MEEDRIAALEARIAALEAKQASDVEYLRDTFDRIDVSLNASKSVEEHFIIPMLLRLAGFGHRSEMREMLAAAKLAIAEDEPLPRRDLELRRVEFWRNHVLEQMPTWHGFDPGEADPEED